MLESRKSILIEFILRCIKGGYFADAAVTVYDLKDLHINWHELDIVLKSLKHDANASSEINEADYMKPDPSTYSKADKIKFTINSIRDRQLGGVAYYIGQWNMTAAEYPKVLEAFEENKSRLIGFLLYMVKSFVSIPHERKDMLKTIRNLIDFGLDWPELKVIQKSLEHESIRINEEELPTEKMKVNLRYSFEAMLNNENYQLIANAFERFNVNTITCPELMRMVIGYKNYILMYLNIKFDDTRNETNIYNLIKYCCYIIKNFRLAGLDWPEFTTLLENKKHQLIKNLLNRIAESPNLQHTAVSILFAINSLKTVVQWPELDVIEKSLKHENNQV
jgi:hypothetical protein